MFKLRRLTEISILQKEWKNPFLLKDGDKNYFKPMSLTPYSAFTTTCQLYLKFPATCRCPHRLLGSRETRNYSTYNLDLYNTATPVMQVSGLWCI